MRAMFCIAAAVFVATPAAASVRSVNLQLPARDFGYLLGDVMTATAVVTADRGTVLDRSSLPEAGPVARQIDIRQVSLTESQVRAGREYRIRITYQSFYGPDAATQTEVPGYRVEFADGTARFAANVPAWHFMASALRHAVVAVTDARGMRADHPAARLLDGSARVRLARGLGLAGLAASSWLIRRGLIPAMGAHRLPFHGAARRVKPVLQGRGQDDLAAAFVLLHRAFDATAGKSVMAGDIDCFMAQQPRFAALRPDILAFYQASQLAFFGEAGARPSLTAAWLLDFARRLARAERG